MVKKAFVAFGGIFLGLVYSTGCKSPTAPNAGHPFVTIIPENLHGVEFTNYIFKAKVENYDPAITYFIWNLGDDTGHYNLLYNAPLTHTYTKPGTFTVTVKVYDYYTDSLIATSSEQIIIDTARSTVKIVPQFVTGILNANTQAILDPFTLSASVHLPLSQLYQFWDFGDGTKDNFETHNSFSHSYLLPGSYQISLDVYQKSGVFVGRDTVTVTISLPPVTIDTLHHAKKIELFLLTDSAYTLFSSLNSPLSIYIPSDISSWSGNNFFVTYLDSTANHIEKAIISGTLAPDLNSISSLSVSIDYHGNANNNVFTYSFSANNMPLRSMTGIVAIYGITGTRFTNNFHEGPFASKNIDLQQIGTYGDYWTEFFEVNPRGGGPAGRQCMVVFSLQ